MAELNSSANTLKGSSRTTHSLSPRVDMTPMVDLMFLLITFFMLTTTLSKSSAIPLTMPVDKVDNPLKIPDNRSMTICLGLNDQLLCYMGNPESAIDLIAINSFEKNRIRKILNDMNNALIKKTGKGLIISIKPSDKSTYKNLVDILDELKILGLDTYFIVDTDKKDIEKLKSFKMY